METLGYPFAAMLAILVCISYFVLEIFINPTPGTHSLSHEENEKLTKFVSKFNHSILPETGKITHRFFDKSMFSEGGLKCHPKCRK